MVDQVANFKKVTVSTGYNNTATSIVLSTSQGAELPDPSGDNYNVVWWDSTNYNDPADDPNVEIVRVTAKSTDTLTVTRNQESSGASNKNNADATYKMILATTAKTISDILSDAVLNVDKDVTNGVVGIDASGDVNMSGEVTLTDKLICQGNIYFTAVNLHPDIVDEVSTYTNPVYVFHGDDNSGWGSGGADSISSIVGGVEGHRITETGNNVDHILSGIIKTPTTQILVGAGAVDIVSAITHVDTTGGAAALTLADGAEGQEKFIVMKTDVGAGTLTPSNLGNGSTITFDDVGDSAHLLFTNGAWHFMGGTATLA